MMKIYLIVALLMMFGYEAYGSCYKEMLLDPDDELCEPEAEWEDWEECVTCFCMDYGFAKKCCDMNPYPVIEDTSRCKLVQEDCEWSIVPKRPQWERRCRLEGKELIG